MPPSPCRGGEAAYAACAAQAEQGHALHVVAEAHPPRGPCFEAGRSDPGGRYGDQAVHLAGRHAGACERPLSRLDVKRLGGLQIDVVARLPAMIAAIPFGRADDVALGDAGIVEDGGEFLEQSGTIAEQRAGDRLRLGLREHDVGHGGRDGQQGNRRWTWL